MFISGHNVTILFLSLMLLDDITFEMLFELVMFISWFLLSFRSMYFHVHVISILAVILLPSKPERLDRHSNNNVKED